MNATAESHIQQAIARDHQKINKKSLDELLNNSWSKIAPSWPLKNLIAVNPLAGLEDLPFEQALNNAALFFQQSDIPTPMQAINRECIKWLQAFFDDGQSTIHMPNRHLGLLKGTINLLRYDSKILKQDKNKLHIIENLSSNISELIKNLLSWLRIDTPDQEEFLTLLLTTLPGWSAYILYRTEWPDQEDAQHPFFVTKHEYIAFRLVITYLMWPAAKQLTAWHRSIRTNTCTKETYRTIKHNDYYFQQQLLNKLRPNLHKTKPNTKVTAQFIFCIDVRSEPFRRAIEAQGAYETFGFAGFFGIPVKIENKISGKSYGSCPVLLEPTHSVSTGHDHKNFQGHAKLHRKIYQSLKYNSITPFALVEIMGLISGLSMTIKSLFARHSIWRRIFKKNKHKHAKFNFEKISIQQQVDYAKNMLNLTGLVDNFAPVVVLCGHASSTNNNAYASALDCGACGGRPGGPNAQIMASIMNSEQVRCELAKDNINIPASTVFVAAEHNTTTDCLNIYDDVPSTLQELLKKIQADLTAAQATNTSLRLQSLGKSNIKNSPAIAEFHAHDWSQVRPEWGLAKNAGFIAGPRQISKDLDLAGRVFLHSYDWKIDKDAKLLNTIMTAPMIVAQWINAQYLFSSLDNVAYGAGSKVTKNITGKIGVMQGNASDLMHGLPLQSVYKSDDEPHHIPTRLTTFIYAPLSYVTKVIDNNKKLKELFANEWLHLLCYDPILKCTYTLQRNLTWKQCP